jgi:protein O-GlcNAc transferase
MSGNQLLREARVLAQNQQWPRLEMACRAILARDFRHPEANRLLGRALVSLGRAAEGAVALAAAVSSQPEDCEARVELGNVLAALRQPKDAVGHYQIAVAARPTQLQWRINLAALLSELGRHEEAVREADSVLALDPNNATALFNQAISLLAMSQPRAACERLTRCALLTPGDPKVHNNLGLALAADHQYEAALRCYDEALRLNPDYGRALNNRGAALMNLGRFEEALRDLQRAIEIEPRNVRALLNRGAALRALRRYEAALESYQLAFPDIDALASATDILLKDLRRRGSDALACAGKLYQLAPDRDGVAGAYHAASQRMAQWSDYELRVARIVAGVRAGRRPADPFRFLWVTDSPEDQLACARAAAASIPPQAPLWTGEIYQHSRIRVGYLSSDFYGHATAYLAAGLFERHDRQRFECFALSHGGPAAGDPMRARLEAAFEHFEDVQALSTQEIAEHVRALEIDVLVDLKGYTGDSRIEVLSHRPAPIQVHYLGYPGTLGAPFVDYLIADRHVIPESQASHYTEQIVHLPHTYQVTDDRRVADGRSVTRERAGLPVNGLVLAAFHQTYKLNPPVFEIWMRLLRRLPEASLWLLDSNLGAEPQLIAEAAARGIEPERLCFAPQVPQAEHLSRQRLADLLLDTWPYSSHTTSSDALWVGLPVVALTGRSFASRVSGSILRAAGFPELVTESLGDYEALITRTCTQPGRLSALRQRIESTVRGSPLFDTEGFTRALENGYMQMYTRHHAGLPPAPIEVAS